MKYKILVKFGPLHIQLYFHRSFQKMYKYFYRWFLPCGKKSNLLIPPDAIFYFSPYKDEFFVNYKISYWDARMWLAFIRETEKNIWSVYCIPQFSNRIRILKKIPSVAIRFFFIDSEASIFEYFQASYALYNIILPIILTLLLKKGYSFIHASSIVYKNNAFLFTGMGNVGKTTIASSIYFNNQNEFTYLGDDFSIIGMKGNIHLNPMPMNIYPYNTKVVPQLKKYLGSFMSFSENLHWILREKIFGYTGAMKRVPLPSIASDISEKPVKINTVFYLTKYQGAKIKTKPLSFENLSYVCKNILLKEINAQLNFFSDLNLDSEKKNLLNIPSVDELGVKIEQIYKEAFANKKIFQIFLPMKITNEIIKEIVEKFIKV